MLITTHTVEEIYCLEIAVIYSNHYWLVIIYKFDISKGTKESIVRSYHLITRK